MYAAPMQSLNQAMGSQSVSTDADLDKWGAIFGPTFPVSNQPYQGGYRTQHENPPADRTLHNGYLGTLVYGVTNLDLPEFLLQILPIQQTSVLDYNWDVMYFNTPMAGIVPHEAAGRVLTHSYSSGGEKSVRHAIGMLMDIETMKRPFGMTMFGLKLQQMRNSIQLTLIGDVIHALLDTNNPNHPKMGKDAKARWMASQGIDGLSPERLIKQEINDYGLVHKDPINGMRRKLQDIKPYAQQWGFKPNAIICNDKFKMFSSDMITDPTLYLIEAYGQTELRRGPDNVAAIDGIPLYAIPPLNLYQETQNIPSLNTHVQIGEYALMIDPRRDTDSQKCEPRTMVERAIMMYDENADDWAQISILEAINACGRFDDNGNLNDMHKKLARIPDNMDMFLCKDANGHNLVCELFGDMEEVYLDQPTVQQMARSMLGSLDDKDRAGVNSLVDLYNSLIRNAGTAPEPNVGAGAPARPAGRDVPEGVNRAAQLNYYVPGGGFFSVTELRDRIRKLDHDEVRHSGFFASWLGLELLAYQNDQVKEHLSAFLRFYHAIKQAVGADHPFVTEEGCPAHLRPYVDEPGACNLFERVFGNRTTPIVAYSNGTSTNFHSKPDYSKAETLGKATAQLSMPLDQLAKMKPTITALDEAEQEKFFTVMKAYTKLGAQMHQLADEIYTTPQARAAFLGHVSELPTKYVKYFDGADVEQFKAKLAGLNGQYVEAAKSFNDETKARTPVETIDLVKKLANFSNLTGAQWDDVPEAISNSSQHDVDVEGSDYKVATNRGGSMLLPIVYTSTRSAAWNGAMRRGSQNIVTNYVFSIYKPSRAGMVPVTVTGTGLNPSEFEGEVESLNEYRSFAHRRLVLQEPSKYGVMEHVDHGDGGEHGRHATERLARQHESQMVKRRAVDPYDQDRMGAYPTDPHFMDDKPSFMHRYEMLHTHPNAAIRGAMFAFLTTKITRDAFKRFAQQGCLVPCNFIIARPFDVHIMGGVMVLEGGLNTGRTMFAMSNWVAGISPETKLFYANYTFYSKAIIFRPERVVHMPALYYEGYCGGHNTIFLTHAERENLAQRGFKLNRQDYAKQDRASMYSMMVPYGETKFDTTFDLRGWFDFEDREKNPTPAYASAQFYSLAYHFDRLRKGMDYGMNLWYKEPQANLVVSAGPWRAWGPDGKFADASKNTWSGTGKGHHGQNIQVGVTAKERSGLITPHPFPKLTSVRGV